MNRIGMKSGERRAEGGAIGNGRVSNSAERRQPISNLEFCRKASTHSPVKLNTPLSPVSAFRSPVSQRASSLITTLLVLVVLSTIVVAFMQSMSVERNVARSVAYSFQAESAALAARDAAIQQMIYAIGTNHAFVTGETNALAPFGPITVIGRTDLTNLSQLMPLVSGDLQQMGSFGTPQWTNAFLSYLASFSNSANLNGSERFIRDTNATNLYRGNWVEIRAENGRPLARYAYAVLDEQARLNPLLHRGTTPRNNPTNWSAAPADIPLTNSAAPLLTQPQATATLQMTNLVSLGMFGQAFTNTNDASRLKHLLTVTANPTFDGIPGWLPGGNSRKFNINVLATNASSYDPSFTNGAAAISGIISTNLTNFWTRDPSLRSVLSASSVYPNRLAANIVDYIDSNDAPTLVNGGEPASKDLNPLVTAIASQYQRTAFNPGSASSQASVTITSRIFVQIWNPYTVAISLNNKSLRFVLRNRQRLNFGTGIVTPFNTYDQTISVNSTIQPNEFVVLEYPLTSQTWTSPGPVTVDATFGSGGVSQTGDQVSYMPFEFYVGGNLVDMSRRPPVGATVPTNIANSGLVHNPKTFNNGNIHYQVNPIPSNIVASSWRFVGDPRGTFMSNYDWGSPISSDTSYANNTRWKGRQDDTAVRTQNFQANWVNRDYVRANPSIGSAPGSISTTPAAVASAYNAAADGPAAIAYLRNGPMISIGELGHIFDPIQAADDLSAPSGGGPASPFVAGGGRTLRIGQPEFDSASANSWNTNGRRAIELLDLFSTHPTNSSGWPTAIGRVNVNTAPPEVLSALFAGIQVTADQGIPAATLTNLPALANTIISNRPYSSLSDLHKITRFFAGTTNYSPAFSSSISTVAGNSSTNLAAMDRVREEAFGKMIQNVTVQSRTYRIISFGESLDPTGRIRGRAALESIVYLQTNSTGRYEPVVQIQRKLR